MATRTTTMDSLLSRNMCLKARVYCERIAVMHSDAYENSAAMTMQFNVYRQSNNPFPTDRGSAEVRLEEVPSKSLASVVSLCKS